jgi:hypothetical protein
VARAENGRLEDFAFSFASATIEGVEVTAHDVGKIPAGNIRAPRQEFAALWAAAEQYQREHPLDWYGAGVVVTCRWLAEAIVRPANGHPHPARSPVTERTRGATPELIEAEYVAAEKLDMRQPRPAWLRDRLGWIEAVCATFRWAWAHTGPAPLRMEERAARSRA